MRNLFAGVTLYENCIEKNCNGKLKVVEIFNLKKEYGDRYMGVDRTYECKKCNQRFINRTTQ